MKKSWKERLAELGVKLSIEKIKMAAHALASGETIYTEAEAPAVGDGVYADEALSSPVADGSYELASGATIIVAEGMIAEIAEKVEESAELEKAVEELAEQVVEANATIATQVTEIANLKAQVAKLTTEKGELTTKLRNMKPGTVTHEQPKAEGIKLRHSNNKGLEAEINMAISDLAKFKQN